MKDIIKKLQKFYSNGQFLKNLNKENELTKFIKQELDVSAPEANIIGYVLYWYIKDGYSVSIRDICEEHNISHINFLKIVDYVKSLTEKGYFINQARGRRSSFLNPDIEIDEIIFKKLIYGEELIEECDYSNFYSIIEKVKSLIDLKEDGKISLKYFLKSIKDIIQNIDKKLTLSKILSSYTLNEVILFLYTFVIIFESWQDSIEINDFAEFIEMKLKDKMELLDKIVSNNLPIFKDEILEVKEEDKNILTSTGSLNITVSNKTIENLLNRKIQKNFKLRSRLLKQISQKEIKKEFKLFFKKDFENELNKIKEFLSEKNFKKVKNELKRNNFSSGLVMLFYGFPGTGKTATVYELAKLTNREILQVDFSQVQSMWVGESEKNMKKIFNEYRLALKNMKLEPILLFNEADSLISRRVNVLDSVDQMSNTLQNILLEELENFEGIFIATTNLINNIDPAFDRRFIYKLKFEKPDKEIRIKIWKNKLPDLNENDIQKISEYSLTGGQIDNIVKKYLINQILYSKALELNEMLTYIKEELNFREENKNSVGFVKENES